MTMCTAWVRQANDTEELVFATDSELSGGGEKWDKGVKLFELPNKDALLCFTGATARAYPLILNLISSITYEDLFYKKIYSLTDLKTHVLELFSTLIKTISDYVEDKHKIRGEARFLFGGWDWEKGQFRIWMILYNPQNEKFEASELTEDNERTNFYVFIGEAHGVNVEDWANEEFTKLLIKEQKLHMKLDMEPLKILRAAALDRSIQNIGGSLQIAKVYKSNKTEFLGIRWPSIKGNPCFQGREYTEINKPAVRYYDPDTFTIIESDLPTKLTNITEEVYQDNFEFVQDCFDVDGYLKEGLPEKAKHDLRLIFKDVAYRQFLVNQEAVVEQTEAGDDL